MCDHVKPLFLQHNFIDLFPDNSNYPFEAVVFVDGTKYGRGQAQNKKAAKVKAGNYMLSHFAKWINDWNTIKENIQLICPYDIIKSDLKFQFRPTKQSVWACEA